MYKIKVSKDKYELVKKYLETISNIPSLIRTKKEYISLRRESGGNMGGSGNAKSSTNSVEDRYIAIADAEIAITRYEDELKTASTIIDHHLAPSIKRTALEKKYFLSRSFVEISDELGYSMLHIRDYIIPSAIDELAFTLNSKNLDQMSAFLSLTA